MGERTSNLTGRADLGFFQARTWYIYICYRCCSVYQYLVIQAVDLSAIPQGAAHPSRSEREESAEKVRHTSTHSCSSREIRHHDLIYVRPSDPRECTTTEDIALKDTARTKNRQSKNRPL